MQYQTPLSPRLTQTLLMHRWAPPFSRRIILMSHCYPLSCKWSLLMMNGQLPSCAAQTSPWHLTLNNYESLYIMNTELVLMLIFTLFTLLLLSSQCRILCTLCEPLWMLQQPILLSNSSDALDHLNHLPNICLVINNSIICHSISIYLTLENSC